MFWTIFVCFIFCSLSFILGLMMGSALTRNQIYEELEEERRQKYRLSYKHGNKFLILMILLLPLVSCVTAPPQEVVIERKCHFEPLRPKPKLPKVDYIEPHEGCPFYLCLDAYNADQVLAEREILLRKDSNYVRAMYKSTAERCGE